ncbi:non-ribosomal peptide synthetase [Streptomyces griseolus]|uniref:non-ribosomal peptide synthetase n=1 Tax=Streptomyces griseolus TaxID=1909 RepID=UPI002242F93C|nr:amino acid adenylation domain-containing protein [Streptomyces griseolus]MCW8217650.1 amino acid adenylation domain-containing protein [Streptomyces griseolus]
MAKNVEAAYPLSALQQGLLFHTLSRPGEPTYFEQVRCVIRGALDTAAFEEAWNLVVARHPVLRTAFAWQRLKEPLQVVGRTVRVPLDQADWRGRSDPDADWQDLLDEDRRRGFDLAKAPLMRLTVRQTADDTHLFVWSHHHILLDGWSFGLVLHEALAAYARLVEDGRPPQLEPAPPYQDFIRYLGDRDTAADETFWREYLEGFEQPTRLAVDRGQGVHEGGGGTEVTLSVTLDKETSAAVQRRCGGLGVSLSALAHAAWARLIGAYSGEDEVLFGSTTAGRPPELPGVEQMVGLFINAVPLRVRIDPARRIGDWLEEIQRDLFRLQAHQFTGLARIQELSGVERGKPLFETLLSFQNYPLDDGHTEDWGGVRLTDYGWSGPTNYPVAVRAFPGDEIMLVLSYYRHRLDDDTAAAMLDQLRLLVERLGGDPERALWEVEPLAGEHAEQVLRRWNETSADIDLDRTLHGLAERQAHLRPDAPAVVAGDGRLTYGELDARANQVARRLVALGVRPGDRVGLCTEKSTATVIGMVAVLKAGAAYVPLDPGYPAERIAYMVADSGLRALLTWGSGAEVAARLDLPSLALDTDAPDIDRQPAAPLGLDVPPESFAYVIYTSGSSGQPKGVMLDHRGRINNVEDYRRRFAMGPGDRTLCVSSLSFDISVCDVFCAFAAGGVLVFPDATRTKDPDHWLDLVEREGITLWHSAPALMDALLDAAEERGSRPASLRLTVLDGDWIPLTQPDRVRGTFPSARVVSAGGATELSVDSVMYPVGDVDPAWRSIPYGRPMANQTAYIVDERMEAVPVGVPGELLLGGAGTAAGYLDRPALTAEKFVPHPWSRRPGERLYRTGDLARFGQDGTIELLGRIDFQVKIRGVRIELGEIESVLREHPEVDTCLVAASPDATGERRLVAYLVHTQDGGDARRTDEPDAFHTELRAWLRRRVPEHLVPEAFVRLDRLPLTANGKVNRRDLPAARFAVAAQGRVAPATGLEAELAAHWAGVLGLAPDEVDVETSFFDMGGNSLKALRACRLPGRSVPITALYRYRGVRALAEHLGQDTPDTDALVRLGTEAPADTTPAVICVPYGGGHAGVYQPLAEALSHRATLYAVRLPGHEHDGTDEPLQAVEPVARSVAAAARELKDRPLLVYGHCGGVALATEITRQLEADGLDVRRLVVAASYPPAEASGLADDPFAEQTDVELARAFAGLGGFTDLTDEEAGTIGRLLRHDGTEARRYFRQALDRAAGRPEGLLATPLTCLIGDSDPLTEDYAEGWRTWGLLAPDHELAVLPGDHYFVRAHPEEVAGRLLAALAPTADPKEATR